MLARNPQDQHWASPIAHPVPLGAALLLAVNDHWLKGSPLLPAALTGKLSDLCGLFFFPLLLAALLRGALALAGRRPGRLPEALLPIVVGVAFTAANLSLGFNGWLGAWWGDKVMDPTDLLALPVLLLSWLWLRRAPALPGRQLVGLGAVVACGLASAATSPLRVSYPRNYPAWTLLDTIRFREKGFSLELWVSKSGKQGMGITLLASNCTDRPRSLRLVLAELGVGEQRLGAELPPARVIGAGELAYLYLSFVFDNEQLWNQQQREGELRVRLRLDDKPLLLTARARHRLDGFHREVRQVAPYQSIRIPTRAADRCPSAGGARLPASSPASRPSGTVLEPVRP